MKLCISARDYEYSMRLAQRLCELQPHLAIEVRKEEELSEEGMCECTLLITDSARSAGLCEMRMPVLFLQKEEICRPAGLILASAAELYEEKTGQSFFPAAQTGPQSIACYGAFGGSGTTAVAVTIGRLLAGHTDRNVLYLRLGDGKTQNQRKQIYYFAPSEKASRPPAELAYRLQNRETVRIENYAARDFYGLYYLMLPDAGQLFHHPETTLQGFSSVILDCGTARPAFSCSSILQIRCRTDSRAELAEAEPEEETVVYNRGAYYQEGKSFFVLSEDGASFSAAETHIEINLHGIFAGDIRKMAKSLNFFNT